MMRSIIIFILQMRRYKGWSYLPRIAQPVDSRAGPGTLASGWGLCVLTRRPGFCS